MNLCNIGHTEVCFESSKCPLCEAMDAHEKETDALHDTIRDMDNRIVDLGWTIDDLRGQIQILEAALQDAEARAQETQDFS